MTGDAFYSDNKIQIAPDFIHVVGGASFRWNEVKEVRMQRLLLRSLKFWSWISFALGISAFIAWLVIKSLDPALFNDISPLLALIYTIFGSISLLSTLSIFRRGPGCVYGVVLVQRSGRTQLILTGDKLYISKILQQVKMLAREVTNDLAP